jgi:hypothetical protein
MPICSCINDTSVDVWDFRFLKEMDRGEEPTCWWCCKRKTLKMGFQVKGMPVLPAAAHLPRPLPLTRNPLPLNPNLNLNLNLNLNRNPTPRLHP